MGKHAMCVGLCICMSVCLRTSRSESLGPFQIYQGQNGDDRACQLPVDLGRSHRQGVGVVPVGH